jgi:hypothetical protein
MARIGFKGRYRRSIRACPRARFAVGAAVAAMWSARPVAAATENWIGGSSDWNTPSNWSGGSVPGTGDTVNIINSDGTSPTISYDYPGPAVTLATLTISATRGTESFSMATSGVTLSTSNQYVGDSGNGSTLGGVGVVTQAAGATIVGTSSFLGFNSVDTGSYVLSGGLLDVGVNEYVGEGGTGAFNASGGTNAVQGQLVLGDLSGSTGLYALSGGSLNSYSETVGNNGVGIFNETGGTNTINSQSSLVIGGNSGSKGMYFLSNAGALVANGGPEYIGFNGTGIFNQTGGTNVNQNYLDMGVNGGSTGTYILSCLGSLSALAEVPGTMGIGTFDQSGCSTNTCDRLQIGFDVGSIGNYTLAGDGSLMVVVTDEIGVSGTGNFYQSGGTHVLEGSKDQLILGYSAGSTGSYTLSCDGSLSAPEEVVGVGGIGIFNQSGGTNSIDSDLNLGFGTGSTGTYLLSCTGTLSVGDTEYVGGNRDFAGPASGTFNQSGGTNSSDGLAVGFAVGSTGAYALSGTGTLSTFGAEYIGYNASGTFNQSGGANAITGRLILGNNVGSTGTYTLSAGMLQVAGNVYVGGQGNTSGGEGIFTIDGPSALFDVSGTVTVFLTRRTGLNMSAGMITAGSLNLIDGMYNQSGGSAIFSNFAGTGTVGINGGSVTLALGGSASQLGNLIVGGLGTLDLQLGGYNQGVNYDLINLTGGASFGGTLEMDLVNGFLPKAGDQFTVITTPQSVIGAFKGLTSNDPSFIYTVDYGPSDNLVRITVASIPEPCAIGFLAIAGGAMLMRRKRRSDYFRPNRGSKKNEVTADFTSPPNSGCAGFKR